MLIELNIRNIALIESLRIEFTRGLNVLTGDHRVLDMQLRAVVCEIKYACHAALGE